MKWPAFFVIALAISVSLTGCSYTPDGPKRSRLSGAITVNGKPVRAGRIIFSPDGKKGNTGPGAVALITDGTYETPSEHGVVSGPHLADILGYDENVDLSTDDEPAASIKKVIEVEIPVDGGQHDFTF